MSPSERELLTIDGAGLVPAPSAVVPRAQVRVRPADAPGVHGSHDFSVVYSRWMPSLTRYCRGILRSDADAEDAAQNAMLKAMDALATGPAPEQLPPWLHRIARNEAISLMRRRDGAVALIDDDHPAGPSLEEVASTRRRLSELLRDLQALPERQREALVLREVDGLAHRQIATQLGITEAAAQQAVLDARRSLHAFEAGRALECDSVQAWLSAHEHARLRTRGVRAHLRDCGDCRDFSTALGSRPRDLAALLPGIGAGGLVARILGLFGGGGSGVKAALATGVLATAGIGIAIAPSDPGRATPDRGATSRPAAVAPAASTSRPVTSAGAADVAAGPGAERSRRRADARRSAVATADRSHDATTRPAPDTSRAPARVAPSGAHSAGSPGAAPAERTATARAPSPAPGATTPRSTAPVAPTLPPGPVADTVAPVLDTVTQTTTTAVDAVTKVVDEVVGSVGTQDLGDTVQGVTGLLGGGR